VGEESSSREFPYVTFIFFALLCIFKMFTRISFEGGSRVEFEAKELCSRYTTDVVATCAYGIQGNALQDPNSEFRQMGKEMLEPSFWSNIRTLIILLLPRLARFLGLG
jgi:cytochrome P450 family 6